MANVSQKTLHWLHSVLLKEYRDSNRAYNDVAQVLQRFPTISPRTDIYTSENGSSALLVHLVGTLPVFFRGMTYRFPMELWIPHTYPYEPPIAYISPTPDMLVRPGRHVSGEGRIYHPYLAQWATAWDRSNIIELISILCNIFSKEPPVVSRQHVNAPPQQSPTPPVIPPRPNERLQESRHRSTSSAAQRNPPPPPPKLQLKPESDESASVGAGLFRRYDEPPVLPGTPHPASQPPPGFHSDDRSPPALITPQRNTSLRQPMVPLHFPEQQNFAQTMPFQGESNVRFSTLPARTPSQFALPPTSSSGAQPPHYHGSVSQPGPSFQNVSQAQHQSLLSGTRSPPHWQQDRGVSGQYHGAMHHTPAPQPKSPPVNLLDSPFDINLPVLSSANLPTPAIPPNPEKDALLSALSESITQILRSNVSQNAASLPLLQSQNEALNSSLRTLESELAQLQTLQSTFTANVSILQKSLQEADECISAAHARAQRGEIPKIDDMLTAPTVVGKQLYDVVCDERGVEAAIWALQAALTRGRISTDVWAKRTRELSREGFKRKVLTRKIASGMGLGE